MDIKFNYGCRVVFSRVFIRLSTDDNKRVWENVRRQEREGLFLGTRVLQNVSFLPSFDLHSSPFKVDRYIKCALISPGPTRNPVYVPLENIAELY